MLYFFCYIMGMHPWLIPLGDLAIEMAQDNKRWPDVVLCASLRVPLSNLSNREAFTSTYNDMRKIIESIEDEEDRQHGLNLLEQYEQLGQNPNLEPSLEEEIQMYKEMARGLGINPDNPKNDIDRVVAIGLEDLNPERVLKNCRHLFVSIGSYGIPGQMLGLQTAGSKWLHCTKHNYSIMSLSLDQLYESFFNDYCTSCKDCIPHDENWHWSRAWQQDQDEKFNHIVQRVRDI